MALKGNCKIGMGTEIGFFMNEVATRGIIVVHDTSTTGVGAAMDDANAVVKIPTSSSGSDVPAGLLLNDVVNLDLTRQHINWHKDEVQLGGKVTVLTDGGWVVTNSIKSGQAPKAGDSAYYAASGELMTSGTHQVGKFLSGKDSDGYAKVAINIPL